MSTKLVKGRTLDLRAAHDTLALGTIVAIVVHGAALLGDQYLHPSILDITLPFVSSYKAPGRGRVERATAPRALGRPRSGEGGGARASESEERADDSQVDHRSGAASGRAAPALRG
jgi:hypothetical protein